MSGHSKWSTIKRKKGATDAKRGKLFSKLIKEVTIAARMGGGDPDGNPRLRQAVAAAKSNNMPTSNIEKAIKRGTGEMDGVSYEEVIFEGYGPGGVAVFVESLTDNRNRTIAEVRHVFGKYGGSAGEAGSVAWMFEKKGVLSIPKQSASEEKIMEIALEAGAEDIREEEDTFAVITDPAAFEAVKNALEQASIESAVAELSMLPQSTVKLQGKEAQKMLHLMEAMEDLDDVQHVYANFDIPEEEFQAWEAE